MEYPQVSIHMRLDSLLWLLCVYIYFYRGVGVMVMVVERFIITIIAHALLFSSFSGECTRDRTNP